VQALMAYVEDEAGGLMSPRFSRARPDMSVDEALSYLRRQARGQAGSPVGGRAPLETTYYIYVLDPHQHLLGVVALGEVRLRDWLRILRRELLVGLALGAILATIGTLRIALWGEFFHSYGEHFMLVALTVGLSLVAIVMWGTLAGAMLPFLLRRVGLNPASASAPFVATLVDVSGLVIYFTLAEVVLGGALL